VCTGAASPVEPGKSNAISRSTGFHAVTHFVHNTHHLVPWDQREVRERKVALYSMEIGVTNAAAAHFHPDLSRAGLGVRKFHELKGVG
jgi:hypothetical protein